MSRRFTDDDSRAFARLSGDYNPIHLDPLVARRLMFGRPVLHGMHLALAMADQSLAGRSLPLRLTRISADFRRPAIAGQSIDLAFRESSDDRLRIDAISNRISLMTLEFHIAPRGPATEIVIPVAVSHSMQPKERTLSDLRDCGGRLPLWMDRELAATLFPNLVRLLPTEQLAVLLATSRLVGMEVPGLHSVWRGFDLSESPDQGAPELTYRVERIDERFSLVNLRVDAPGLSGALSTGLRSKPSIQAGYDAIRSRVHAAEFGGQRALVIGGSRGLGEVTVKLLAAGGADVRFSYHHGAEEADQVARQITQSGGSARCFQYDVLEDATKLPALLGDWRPTLLCYFATPFIFGGVQGRFSNELFRQFCDFYVTGFNQTLAGLVDVKRVLYPSSTAIDMPVPNLMEYTAAKAAGESLCRSLAAAQPERRFVCPRFGRLATDQTASLLQVSADDPVEPVLAALRKMRD